MSDQGSSRVFNDRYEVHRRIARGGMADVYLARDLLLDRPVALKVLFPEFATDPSFVERFRREAQAAANLSHPNIVNVYDSGEANGTYFIVMEYVEGRSLAQIIRDEGPLHADRAADITTDIAAALGFAHRNGVIHRDVKPGNVLISPIGQVKVTDFGIARAVSTQENLTQTGTVMGTATYFSPEQARGESVDPRSDVYALGVVLYEMLTGRPPFTGENPVTVAYKHVQETPMPPRTANPDVPMALDAITLKTLAKNPANRYPSADDLAADLRRFRDGRDVLAEPVLPPPAEPTTAIRAARPDATRTVAAAGPATAVGTPAATPPPQRSSALFVVVLLALLALLGVLVFLFARNLGLGSAEQVTVPDVRNRAQPEAQAILESAGLTVATEQRENPDVAEGIVFDQDPAPGSEVDEDSTVTLLVSSAAAPVEVPSLVGERDVDADARLRELGLVADFEPEEDPDVPAGTVIAQDPPPGEELPRGSAVRLTISNGPGTAAVPEVEGLTEAQAGNELGRAGFEVEVVREPSGDDVGTVTRTDPPAGTDLEKGETVRVFVSSGVPDVVGLTREAAIEALQRAGIAYTVTTQAVADRDDDGVVIDQTPEAGTNADGAAVQLVVGEFIGGSSSTTSTTSTTEPDDDTTTTTTSTTSTTTAPGG